MKFLKNIYRIFFPRKYTEYELENIAKNLAYRSAVILRDNIINNKNIELVDGIDGYEIGDKIVIKHNS